MPGQKSFGKALNATQFLVWSKTFEMAQSILGPVKGQGILYFYFYDFLELGSKLWENLHCAICSYVFIF